VLSVSEKLLSIIRFTPLIRLAYFSFKHIISRRTLPHPCDTISLRLVDRFNENLKPFSFVIPAKAGIQHRSWRHLKD
jgi:hypothetical protein